MAAVQDASRNSRQETERARQIMAEAADVRAGAVQAALDAGIPRQEIATAAGTDRNNLYRIVGRKSR
ncbi:hypothetical protein D5R93_05810 [Actinomyces lilanjuaniae]|uniref:Uncharacterized protein n=1 Tax=Actinomyces lilanjuaniae TaxID=2321394 RepID=A0ABM6Z6J5_9ACTO|nr:hypothetical protein D5R93_05810 [Actinomyces lilanjuaniae]